MPFAVKTVFVVGAGAHHDYGMPTGKQLLDVMVNTLRPNGPPSHATPRFLNEARDRFGYLLKADGYSSQYETDVQYALAEGAMQELAAALANSGARSVDEFLERNQDFVDIGIKGMAVFLSAYEQQSISMYQPGGWYRWLFNRLFVHDAIASRHTLDTTNLQIISFNYDRLAEFYLQAFLRNSCAKHLPPVDFTLPIEHVYGRLNTPHTWSMDTKMFTCDLSHSYDALAAYRSTAKHIRIATTRGDEDASQQYANAQRAVAECSRLVFLGFGFNQQNLRRIGVPAVIAARRNTQPIAVFASAVGLTRTDKRRIDGYIGNLISTEFLDAPCETCLNEWGLD